MYLTARKVTTPLMTEDIRVGSKVVKLSICNHLWGEIRS
jgi:hypothetical protein